MMYSNKLDLTEFFDELKDIEYVIVKISDDFPNYYPGSDVDIFCLDVNKIAKRILKVGNKYLNQNFYIRIDESKSNLKQIDFVYDGKIDFRFDLYGAFPKYSNINIRKFYFYSIIDRRTQRTLNYNKKKISVWVPEIIDEMIIRYLDYLEYFAKRKDKIKHLDFIRKEINESLSLEVFLDRFYLYISFPENRPSISYLKKKKLVVADLLAKVRRRGIFGSIKKILFG